MEKQSHSEKPLGWGQAQYPPSPVQLIGDFFSRGDQVPSGSQHEGKKGASSPQLSSLQGPGTEKKGLTLG